MKLKKIFIMLFLAFGALAITMSCSDDDESDLCDGLTQEQCDDLL